LNPDSETHLRWMKELDQLADGLQQLKDAGVVVLWRPFHEMNGGPQFLFTGSHKQIRVVPCDDARGGPGCLRNKSASLSRTSAGVMLPCGVAAG
jgi:hypothetical protein